MDAQPFEPQIRAYFFDDPLSTDQPGVVPMNPAIANDPSIQDSADGLNSRRIVVIGP